MAVKASTFFTKDQQEKIRGAIKIAEKETSGEIRVHIETKLHGNVLDRAAWVFKKIGMHATENREGVLFYVAIRNREFAIIGDKGINAKVLADFWNKIMAILQKHFRNKNFTEGLVEGILMAGEQLKVHFPYKSNDVNELPDEITFDNPK